MHADLRGSLRNIDKSWQCFEHRGQPFKSKQQVIQILKYGISKGYETTADFTDEELDALLGTKTKQQDENTRIHS
jgi:hypothetical protein